MFLRQFPEKKQFKELAQQFNVIPVCAEILADMETPVSLLQKCYDPGSPLFLFESVEGGERWGRYSFLGISAISDIRVYREHIVVNDQYGEKTVSHNGQPFDYIRDYMKQFNPATLPELPRFWGGLVGYLTYEAVSFFERIPHQWPAEKPLAHFMVPDFLLIFDNTRHTLMIITNIFPSPSDDPEALYQAAHKRLHKFIHTIETQELKKMIPPQKTDLKLRSIVDEEVFRSLVSKTKEYIYAGDIFQCVLSQPFMCDEAPDLLTLYRAQRFINPSPYLYLLQLDDMALVGSSPETMVRLEADVATLRPIAGTRPRGATEQEDRFLADEMLQDEKERAEHLMLVDLGRNDLGRIAQTGSVQVTDMMIVERYSHVMHLVSNICCDIKLDMDAWDLLRATFPAGTLSGAPKIRAMEIISELEDTPRGPYGGAVGYVSFDGNLDMAITIRTAMIHEGKLTVRAGAGIVADSDPEKERIETVNKAMALQKAVQMATQNHIAKEIE